ncbi:MAG: 4-hydroxy-3-methylbut-2-enyl diphosphate reductase [Planctomycetota bacterium]|jgi:4-hydroxy-3-methylbut-2-enyl diphosphate reductase
MKVILAKSAGFCMGVRRAMNMLLDRIQKGNGKVYTYGDVIHNPQVVELLSERGVESRKEASEMEEGATVTIRSHGIPPAERAKLEKRGLDILDATCPHVHRIHVIAGRRAAEGYNIIVVGDREHSEVSGILGAAGGRGHVVSSLGDFRALPEFEKVCLVAQTTQNSEIYKEISSAVREAYPDALIFETICDSTEQRQKEIRELAASVDALVVVGGKNSANTTRLVEIGRELGLPTFHVETESELESEELLKHRSIGVTAGASTPNWMIRRVLNRLVELDLGRHGSAYRLMRSIFRFLIAGNLYLASGAAAFTWCTAHLQRIQRISWQSLVVSFCYIFAIHTVNRYYRQREEALYQLGDGGSRRKVWKIVIAMTWIAGAVLIGVGATLHWISFIVLLGAIGLGLAYGFAIVPRSMGKLLGGRKLKDIPASKDIFCALGWGAVIALLPVLGGGYPAKPAMWVAFAVVFIVVFVRSTLMAVTDVQRDQAVGKETIPVVLGLRKTKAILVLLTFLLAVLLVIATSFGVLPALGWWMLAVPAYMFLYLALYHLRITDAEYTCEGVVDGAFLLTGALTAAYLLTG